MNVLCIHNPNSGKGKSTLILPVIKEFIKSKGDQFSVFELHDQESLEDYVKKNVTNYEVLICVGGDGTFSSVFSALMLVDISLRPKVMLIPQGTSNDVSTLLKIPKKLNDQLKMIYQNNLYDLNIIKVNDRYCIYAAAAGKFTNSSYGASRKLIKKFGYWAYVFTGILSIFRRQKLKATIKVDNKEYSYKCLTVFVLGAYRNASMNLFKINKTKRRFVDDKLEIIAFRRRSFISIFKIPLFYLSQGRFIARSLHYQSPMVEIELEPHRPWNIDGEIYECEKIKFELIQKQFKVFSNISK